jgi:hypothetical protein
VIRVECPGVQQEDIDWEARHSWDQTCSSWGAKLEFIGHTAGFQSR